MNDQKDCFVPENELDPLLIIAQYRAEHKESMIAGAHKYAFNYIVTFMLSLRDLSLPNWHEANATWEKLDALYRVLERHMEACAQDPSLDINEPPFHEVEHTKEDFLLFLEALERLERVSAEAEAYRNQPPPLACNLL